MQVTSATMLANYLQDRRKKGAVSQSEAAKSVGIKQTTVSAFENNPDGTKLATLFKLLAALDLELSVNERSTAGSNTPSWEEEW